MPTSTIEHVIDEPVRISVLVVGNGDAETVSVDGPMRRAVRAAFRHPRLTGPLETLHMDPDRLIGRIASRWQNPRNDGETRQMWEKSDGSTTVRWWVDRGLPSSPRITAV